MTWTFSCLVCVLAKHNKRRDLYPILQFANQVAIAKSSVVVHLLVVRESSDIMAAGAHICDANYTICRSCIDDQTSALHWDHYHYLASSTFQINIIK